MSYVFSTDQPDPLEKLPALAKRLGVEPITDKRSSVILTTATGVSYDLFDLVNAVLDRLEKEK